MTRELWIAMAIFITCMTVVAWLRGPRAAGITAAFLIAVGLGYFALSEAFGQPGKWALAGIIVFVGGLTTLLRVRKQKKR